MSPPGDAAIQEVEYHSSEHKARREVDVYDVGHLEVRHHGEIAPVPQTAFCESEPVPQLKLTNHREWLFGNARRH